MSFMRKIKIYPQAIPNYEHTLTRLRHTVCSKINLLNPDRVTDSNKLFHKRRYGNAMPRSKQSLNIFKNEPSGAQAVNDA